MMEKVDIAIIGAGIVGLAIAYELSRQTNKTVVVLEKNPSFGLETSSRNSQVIHSGIYYPSTMLKTQLCVEGRERLYDFCNNFRVDYKKLGKIIVAPDADDLPGLQYLMQQGSANQVEAHLLSSHQINQLEPLIDASEALYLPESGIVDVHQLMQQLYTLSRFNNVIFCFRSKLIGLEYNGHEYILETDRDKFKAEWVINSAGLSSDTVPALLGLKIDNYKYRIYPCKGEYYTLKKPFAIRHLIYPLPGKSGLLGIHITPDMTGRLRLGPNAYDISTLNYDIDNSHQESFYLSVRKFLPDLKIEDIAPDFAGIRPRLQNLSKPLNDFIINEESHKGFPQLINLIGIESPGLTSCLAIAGYVMDLII